MSNVMLDLCWPLSMQPTAKAVLICMADRAKDTGVCWPSISDLSKRTCFSKRAVIRAIEWLESSSAITANRDNGRHTDYVLTPESYVKPVPESNRCQKVTGASPSIEPVPDMHQPVHLRPIPVPDMHTNHKEPLLTISNSNPQNQKTEKDEGSDDFKRWWKVYPSAGAKPQCIKKWRKDKLDEMVDELIADTQNRIKNDRRWLEGFAPNPLTYLNQERYNDIVHPAKTPVAQPSKTMGGLKTLQERIDGTLDGTRNSQRFTEIDDPWLGQTARLGRDRGDFDDVG